MPLGRMKYDPIVSSRNPDTTALAFVAASSTMGGTYEEMEFAKSRTRAREAAYMVGGMGGIASSTMAFLKNSMDQLCGGGCACAGQL